MTTRKESVDFIVIGAGLSGICATYHIQKNFPGRSILILESRATLGGTWDLFKYPGIRSDSDMFTLGFSFNPWPDPKSIADGPTILKYLHDTVDKFEMRPLIRYNTQIVKADFSSHTGTWTLDSNDSVYECKYLFMCAGYYKYDSGYLPEFKDYDKFKGKIVHPQFWDTNLDYKNKKVVVIGSGATAVTLIPSMAEETSHITMLQRSPTYLISSPRESKIGKFLVENFPPMIHGPLTKWYHVTLTMYFYWVSKTYPGISKKFLLNLVKRQLPKGYDVKTHFTPSYDPWDQRVCLVPNGDIFKAIREGKADVVTDHIDRFTEKGILLKSGKELETDIIVTATGLNIQVLGNIEFSVDGDKVALGEKVTYKGFMLSDIPNLGVSLGYTNSSWTLKCDLTNDYMCRVIMAMEKKGCSICCAKIPNPSSFQKDSSPPLQSGYLIRSLGKLPSQGLEYPWRIRQNYFIDYFVFRFSSTEDECLKFYLSGNVLTGDGKKNRRKFPQNNFAYAKM